MVIRMFDEGMTWDEAKVYCEDIGGNLVIIESQEEQLMLEGIMDGKNFYWLGASIDNDDDWLWINGESIGYSNWHSTQPDNFTGNETCLMIYITIQIPWIAQL